MPRTTTRARSQAIALEFDDSARLIASLPLALVLSAGLWSVIIAAVLR